MVPTATSAQPAILMKTCILTSSLYALTARIISHRPSTAKPAWNAYGASITGAMNDALRRNPSADT